MRNLYWRPMPLALGWMLCLLMAGAAAPPAWTQPKSADLTEDQRKLNLESFEEVWSTIRDKHWDAKLGGLDWQAIHDELKPKVESAKSQKEVREVLGDMLGRLKQSHFGIIPKEVYDEVAGDGSKENPTGKGVPGFEVRVLDGKAIVYRVESDQPAVKLGVKPGWEVVKVGKDEVAALLAKVTKALKKEDHKSLDRELAVAVLRKLRGNQGDKLSVTFRDAKGKDVTLELPLVRPKGTATKLGALPTLYVEHEAKKLDKNIAYFRLSTFADLPNVMPAFEKTVRDNINAAGFIIDVRGNPGGVGGMAMGFSNWFISGKGAKLGTMITRDGSLNFVLSPRPVTYDGPLAILVDGLSGSTSEILAGGLKDLKRATIIGTRTMGAALPSVVVRLPNKDGFQYAIANYLSTGGKALEGHGVEPDLVVPLTQKSLLSGRDLVIDVAVAWVRAQQPAEMGS